MLVLLSPAKKLDYEQSTSVTTFTQPEFLEEAKVLVKLMQSYNPQALAKLMGLSDQLAALNVARFGQWKTPFTLKNAKQAIFAFKGDVYVGLDANSLKLKDFNYAQKYLRILSGLYGCLRPMDLMQAYRLEMGTRVANSAGEDLYAFWQGKITAAINEAVAQNKSKYVVNLASQEYFKAVQAQALLVPVITPVFKDEKKGQFKIISFFAKKARGLMARFIMQNRIKQLESLKDFTEGGYWYDDSQSNDQQWVFCREERG